MVERTTGELDTLVWVLLPSPLLGPAAWRPVAEVLRARGLEVAEVTAPPVAPATAADALESMLDAVPDDRPVVLVPHSNAGLFVPSIVRERDVQGCIFVDAGLPPRVSPYPTAGTEFREFLAGLADESGLLPVWTDWWAPDVVEFPSGSIRDAVTAEQVRLPLGYFDSMLTSDEGWDDRTCGYLAFGDTYAAELADASSRGWATEQLPGEHLQLLFDPEAVADAIVRLGPRLARPGTRKRKGAKAAAGARRGQAAGPRRLVRGGARKRPRRG